MEMALLVFAGLWFFISLFVVGFFRTSSSKAMVFFVSYTVAALAIFGASSEIGQSWRLIIAVFSLAVICLCFFSLLRHKDSLIIPAKIFILAGTLICLESALLLFIKHQGFLVPATFMAGAAIGLCVHLWRRQNLLSPN